MKPIARISACLTLLLVTVFAHRASAADLPNILWITSEDNGPELGCYGDDYAITPHIDGLAEIPEKADNAKMVRVFVHAEPPMDPGHYVQSVAVFVDNNPRPFTSRFDFAPMWRGHQWVRACSASSNVISPCPNWRKTSPWVRDSSVLCISANSRCAAIRLSRLLMVG